MMRFRVRDLQSSIRFLLRRRRHHQTLLQFHPSSSSSSINRNVNPRIPIPYTFNCCSSSATADSGARISADNADGDDVSNGIADRVYETVMANSAAHEEMESALDQLGLDLTTDLVDRVLVKLRYDEKLAFRFFTWGGNQENYSHAYQLFNKMIDILSSTSYKSKQFGIICHVLDQIKRRNTTAIYSISVDALLTILRDYTEKHLSHLSKFVKKKRIRVESGSEINAFNLFLDSLCKCGLVREAQSIFHKLNKTGKIKMNDQTYNILFFGWCRLRSPKNAMKVLEEMIAIGLTPENFTYNAAIDTFCNTGMITEARQLFEFMRNHGSSISSPTAKTYSYLIVALAKADRMDECFKLLADMKTTGCLPDVSTFKDLIEGMCSLDKIESTYRMLEVMTKVGYPPDILTYNCFLKVLCNLKNSDEALNLCNKMIESGCQPSVHTYNMVIQMFFSMDQPDRAMGIWCEMDSRGAIKDVDTYCIMVDGLFECSRPEDACLLLDEIMERGLKLPYRKFEGLLGKLSEIGNLQAIHRLSEHMGKFYNRAMSRRYAVTQKKKSVSLRRRVSERNVSHK